MSEPSPYRDLGFSVRLTQQPPRRRLPAYIDAGVRVAGGWGHRWRLADAEWKAAVPRAKALRYAQVEICDFCKQPKCVVDGKPCRGKRK